VWFKHGTNQKTETTGIQKPAWWSQASRQQTVLRSNRGLDVNELLFNLIKQLKIVTIM